MKLIALFVSALLSLPMFGQQDLFPDGTPIPEWFRQNEIVNIRDLGTAYNLADYGVVNDSTVLQTEKIQAVIDRAAEQGGVVIVPKGTYLTGALFFKPRTTNGDVVIGKFFTGQFGGRIDGSPLLADNEYLHVAIETQVLQEVFRLTAGRTVADGHGFDAVSFHHLLDLLCRFFRLADGWVRVNVLVVKQVALRIETYHFATCTEAGIDTHDALLP